MPREQVQRRRIGPQSVVDAHLMREHIRAETPTIRVRQLGWEHRPATGVARGHTLLTPRAVAQALAREAASVSASPDALVALGVDCGELVISSETFAAPSLAILIRHQLPQYLACVRQRFDPRRVARFREGSVREHATAEMLFEITWAMAVLECATTAATHGDARQLARAWDQLSQVRHTLETQTEMTQSLTAIAASRRPGVSCSCRIRRCAFFHPRLFS